MSTETTLKLAVDNKRCPICSWPLAVSAKNGCVIGNCSYKPERGTEEYARVERNRQQYDEEVHRAHGRIQNDDRSANSEDSI
jgi:hypothetical protein